MLERLRWLLRQYFGFRRAEINGFMVIVVGLVALCLWVLLVPYMVQPPYSARQDAQDRQALDSLLHIWKANAAQEVTAEKPKSTTPALAEATLFNFDPNTLSKEGFEQLGFATFMAERIIKYREKGGKFRIKADFQKLYGLQEKDYQRLHPFILLPAEPEKRAEKSNAAPGAKSFAKSDSASSNSFAERKKPFELLPFDINQADTTQLKKVKGIGSAYALRIVKFREALGGFHSVGQLQEVYGLKEEALAELMKYAQLPAEAAYQKIRINTASVDSLALHPYVRSKMAKLVVAYRNQHGAFASADDLLKIRALKKEEVEKLLPYLSFE